MRRGMMSKYRVPSEKSKYYIPKEDYLTAIHYSLRYPLLKQEVEDMANTARAIVYDKDKVQTSGNYDSTYEAAVRIQEKQHKIQLIDETIEQVAGDLADYLRKGVCYGLTFDQLKGKGMPCEDKKYYTMRRHYYYELSKKI
jgi:hypothetical protein